MSPCDSGLGSSIPSVSSYQQEYLPDIINDEESENSSSDSESEEELSDSESDTEHYSQNSSSTEIYSLYSIALQEGNEEVENFLARENATGNITVNARRNDGFALLHLAAIEGSPEVVRFLIDNGADVNAGDKDGNTPLMFATDHSVCAAEILLKHGADVNARNKKDGNIALHFATERDNTEVVKCLLQFGAMYNIQNNKSKTPANLAKNIDIINLLDQINNLFNHDAEITKDFINIRDCKGNTLLHIAARDGSLERAKFLLSNNVNVDSQNKEGNTSLHLAVENGHLEFVKYLLQYGAMYDIQNYKRKTPSDLAKGDSIADRGIMFLTFLVINLFFELELEIPDNPYKIEDFINIRDYQGNTLLHIAAWHGKVDKVELLIKNNANVNSQNQYGYTPLKCAKEKNQDAVVKCLSKHMSELEEVNIEPVAGPSRRRG